MTVIGFDCGLLHAHFCALNKRLNDDRFEFVFAAVGETSGMPVPITGYRHAPATPSSQKRALQLRCRPALDDYAASRGLVPTHLKIDVDGAEFGVLKGAEKILANPALTDIFIEIDKENAGIVEFLEARGFCLGGTTSRKMPMYCSPADQPSSARP